MKNIIRALIVILAISTVAYSASKRITDFDQADAVYDDDEFLVYQGGVTKKETLLQIKTDVLTQTTASVHTSQTGTNVHGLGTMSTETAANYSTTSEADTRYLSSPVITTPSITHSPDVGSRVTIANVGPVKFYESWWDGIFRIQSIPSTTGYDGGFSILSVDAPYDNPQEATMSLVLGDMVFDLFSMNSPTHWGINLINGAADPSAWKDFKFVAQNGYGGPDTTFMNFVFTDIVDSGPTVSTTIISDVTVSGTVSVSGVFSAGTYSGLDTASTYSYEAFVPAAHSSETGTNVHGLGTMSTQDAGNVNITGGLISGITVSTAVTSMNTGTVGVNIKPVVIEIGDWNMYVSGGGGATDTAIVNHGLTLSNIRTPITIIIRKDNGELAYYPSLLSWTVDSDSVDIVSTGGVYDSTFYNSTSFNRGWVTIWYEE